MQQRGTSSRDQTDVHRAKWAEFSMDITHLCSTSDSLWRPKDLGHVLRRLWHFTTLL